MTTLAAFDWPAQLKAGLPFLVGLSVPLVAIWLKIEVVDKHRDKQRNPPTTQKLLRPPGYSLMLRLDEVFDKFTVWLLAALGCWGIAVGSLPALLPATRFLLVHKIGLVSLVMILFFIGLGTWLLIRLVRLRNETRQLRLGLRGEQAVGEILAEVADEGYRTFHDLPGDGDWNVDHVCVGTRGVFVLETKTRSKPLSRAGKPQYKVVQNGDRLSFPNWEDRKTIPQAVRNAR